MAGMELTVVEEGSGDRVVVLLHGLAGSGESWWQVSALLAGQGCRVLALDLPGHGRSAPDPDGSVDRAADAVVHTVGGMVDGPVSVAIGHSYGALVLTAAAERLGVDTAVFVDAPLRLPALDSREGLVEHYRQAKVERTAEHLRSTRPHYGERDIEVEARAALGFDPETAAAALSRPAQDRMPTPGSIVVRAEPSEQLSEADDRVLEASGVAVRKIPGAHHSVWYGHFDEFVAALPEVFGP